MNKENIKTDEKTEEETQEKEEIEESIDKEKSEILKKTAREYFNAGEDEFKKERYNSSVVLFFKALVALVDLYILQEIGDTPSSHTERFRITQDKFSDVYDLLDKDFPFYQDSYVHIMSK